MGQWDSSKTRVQPVFRQLFDWDPTGEKWLLPLLQLGSRSRDVQIPKLGHLVGDPHFEHPLLSPSDYLTHLINTPSRVNWKSLATIEGEETRQKREQLRSGNRTVQDEALSRIKKSRESGRGKWHVLEGTTSADSFLRTSYAEVFFEGKRTEPLKHSTTWDGSRHQVFRNLDSLRAACQTDCFLLMLVVEEGLPAHRDAHLYDRFEIARQSWPQLDQCTAERLYASYLGFTTWQSIVGKVADLGGPTLYLPRDTDDAKAHNLIGDRCACKVI